MVKAGTAIELVAQGFDGTEGPLRIAGRLADIHRESRRPCAPHRAPTARCRCSSSAAAIPNALARGPDGSIIAAQTAAPGIAVIYPADKARVLATSFEGKPLNRPNDLIVDRTGGIYFTDPGAGADQRQPGVAALAAPPVPALYFLHPKGELRQLTTEIKRPNGVSLSPDEKTLYVADTLR